MGGSPVSEVVGMLGLAPFGARRLLALARGWHLGAIIVALLVLGALVAALPDEVPLPVINNAVPLYSRDGVLAALVAAMLILVAADEPVDPLFTLAPRNRRVVRIVRICAVTTAAAGTLAASDPATALGVVTALLTLTGEGLILATIIGLKAAWVLPLLHAMAAAVLGAGATDEFAFWAWIVDPSPSPTATALAAAIYLVAIAATYVIGPGMLSGSIHPLAWLRNPRQSADTETKETNANDPVRPRLPALGDVAASPLDEENAHRAQGAASTRPRCQ